MLFCSSSLSLRRSASRISRLVPLTTQTQTSFLGSSPLPFGVSLFSSSLGTTDDLIQLTLGKDERPFIFVRGSPRAWGAESRIDLERTAGVPKELLKNENLRVAVLREPFRGSTAAETPLSQVFIQQAGDTLVLSSSLVAKENVQLADVYDSQGRITTTNNTDLRDLLRSLGLKLSFSGQAKEDHAQSTNEVLMVAPTAFEFNALCAEDNHFMSFVAKEDKDSARARVLSEYSGLYKMLVNEVGLKVHLFQHDESHGTPDACFPNNWFSTHGRHEFPAASTTGGTALVTYPLKSSNRRLERREDILQYIATIKNYERRIHLEEYENENENQKENPKSQSPLFLEGTGSLVLDRANKVAYAALSERCNLTLAEKWVEEIGYAKLVPFHSYDAQHKPVYHTNVLMAVGTSVAVVCSDSVKDQRERKAVLESLAQTGHQVVEINHQQMNHLCGNVLEVISSTNHPAFVMSTQSYNAFTQEQREVLSKHVQLHHAPIDTLERIGGGGVRCCIAEIF